MRRCCSDDDQRVALSADVDAIDVVPELLERDLADDPAGLPARGHDADGNRGAGQSVVVDLDGRDVGALGADVRRFGNGQRRAASTRLVASTRPPALKNVISLNSGKSRT